MIWARGYPNAYVVNARASEYIHTLALGGPLMMSLTREKRKTSRLMEPESHIDIDTCSAAES